MSVPEQSGGLVREQVASREHPVDDVVILAADRWCSRPKRHIESAESAQRILSYRKIAAAGQGADEERPSRRVAIEHEPLERLGEPSAPFEQLLRLGLELRRYDGATADSHLWCQCEDNCDRVKPAWGRARIVIHERDDFAGRFGECPIPGERSALNVLDHVTDSFSSLHEILGFSVRRRVVDNDDLVWRRTRLRSKGIETNREVRGAIACGNRDRDRRKVRTPARSRSRPGDQRAELTSGLALDQLRLDGGGRLKRDLAERFRAPPHDRPNAPWPRQKKRLVRRLVEIEIDQQGSHGT